MERTVVRVICAIGRSGQLGLNGHLPWEGNRDPEFVADVERFFEITRGHVLMAGPKTIGSVPDFARADREIFVLRSDMDPEQTLKRFAGRVVFIDTASFSVSAKTFTYAGSGTLYINGTVGFALTAMCGPPATLGPWSWTASRR